MATRPTNPETFLDRDNFIKAVLASKLPDKTVRVLIRLAMFLIVKEGRLDPSCSQIAEASGVGQRTVFRVLGFAERVGLITVERAVGRNNSYTLTTAIHVAEVTTATHMAEVAASTTAKIDPPPLPNRGGTTANKVADSKRFKAKKEEAGEKESRASRSDIDDTPDSAPHGLKKDANASTGPTAAEAFEEFWAAYPRKVAKAAARKAFDKVLKAGGSADVLIAGAQRYAVERAGQDPQYTKHPATWLSAGCWEDELPGAPIIDESGEVIAYEKPPPQHEQRGMLAAYDRMMAGVARKPDGNPWYW